MSDETEEPQDDLTDEALLGQGDPLEVIDRAVATYFLTRARRGVLTASDVREARAYLTMKGYRGASLNGLKRAGVKPGEDSRLDLSELEEILGADQGD